MDERDESDFEYGTEEPRRKPKVVAWAISAGLVLLAGCGLIAWVIADRLGGDSADGAAPLVSAESEPVKVKPEEPGGMDVPNQDKLVYERLTGEEEGVLEQLLPPPEEPVLSAEDEQTVAAAANELGGEPAVGEALPEAAGEAGGAAGEAAGLATEQGLATTPLPQESAAADTGAETPGDDAAAAQEEPAAEPQIAAATSPEPAPAMPSAGDFVVQVAAVKDQAAAAREAERVKSSQADLLGSTTPDIQTVDLGADKGVFHRVRFGFFDRTGAEALCAQLKGRGIDCLVAQK